MGLSWWNRAKGIIERHSQVYSVGTPKYVSYNQRGEKTSEVFPGEKTVHGAIFKCISSAGHMAGTALHYDPPTEIPIYGWLAQPFRSAGASSALWRTGQVWFQRGISPLVVRAGHLAEAATIYEIPMLPTPAIETRVDHERKTVTSGMLAEKMTLHGRVIPAGVPFEYTEEVGIYFFGMGFEKSNAEYMKKWRSRMT